MGALKEFVCLLGLVAVCHAACFFQRLELKDLSKPPKGCVDSDGKEYKFGSEWQRDCMACSCAQDGLSCCSIVPEGGMVAVPEDCELIVDRKACTAKVVLKKDKKTICNPI